MGLLATLLVALGAAYPLAAEAVPAASSAIADDWQQFLASETPEALDVRNSGAAWESFLAERVQFMRADAYAAAWERALAGESDPQLAAAERYAAAWERALAGESDPQLAAAERYAAAWERALAGESDLQLAAAERYAAAWERSLARDQDLQLAVAQRYADAWEGFMATWEGCETLAC
jgi:hypothetical protein